MDKFKTTKPPTGSKELWFSIYCLGTLDRLWVLIQEKLKYTRTLEVYINTPLNLTLNVGISTILSKRHPTKSLITRVWSSIYTIASKLICISTTYINLIVPCSRFFGIANSSNQCNLRIKPFTCSAVNENMKPWGSRGSTDSNLPNFLPYKWLKYVQILQVRLQFELKMCPVQDFLCIRHSSDHSRAWTVNSYIQCSYLTQWTIRNNRLWGFKVLEFVLEKNKQGRGYSNFSNQMEGT